VARITKQEKEKRIVRVAEWIIDGLPDYKLLETIKKEWGVTLRQARNYKKWANERIRPQNDFSIEDKRSRKVLEIQKRCMLMGKDFLRTPKGLNAWVNAQKLIIKLEDLEPVKKVQLSGDEENPLAIKWVEEKTYVKPEEEI